MNPKISIIVPVLNRQELILRCLDSIAHQTLKPFELIVVDNGSVDLTFSVVNDWMIRKKSMGIKFQLLTENRKSAGLARQKGLDKSSGDYVFSFDSDDEMHPDLIYKVSKKITENPEADIICWKCRIHMLDGSQKIPSFIPYSPLGSHLIHTLLRPQGYLVKKTFLIKAGGWSKKLKVWLDYELGVRLLLQNPVIIFLPEVLAEIYAQKESLTGVSFSTKEGEWEKTLQEVERIAAASTLRCRTIILKILKYRKAILASCYLQERNKEAALRLMKEAVRNAVFKDRILLKFAHYYTLVGLRGAWRIIRIPYFF